MSSNPTPSAHAVKLRGISVDFSEIGPQIEEHDLGKTTSEALTELLEKFAAIDPVRLVDSEPEILLTGRRGRFTVRSHQGKLNVQATGDATAAFQTIPATAIPEWLDQAEGTPLIAGSVDPTKEETVITDSGSSRQGLVTVLLILSLIAVGVSAYFTYQPSAIDNPKDYTAITDLAELARIDQQARGRFVNVDGTVALRIEDDRRVVLVESDGSNNATRDETTTTYTPMTDVSGANILFTTDIGIIIVNGPNSLGYNADTYTRAK